ncbi:MAG: hypothetical protein KAG97_06230, partial [Victivallales bacterium]|nr:hypothetical protein [Victivallales bacterium]
GFIGFQGHFPGNPILPGICQVEMALAALEKAMERKVSLKTLTRGKYLNMVKPNETVTLSGVFEETADQTISAKFALFKPADPEGVSRKPAPVSRLSLVASVLKH